MADERFFVMTVECQHLKLKHRFHSGLPPALTAPGGNQTIQCINCNNHFPGTVFLHHSTNDTGFWSAVDSHVYYLLSRPLSSRSWNLSRAKERRSSILWQ